MSTRFLAFALAMTALAGCGGDRLYGESSRSDCATPAPVVDGVRDAEACG